MDRYQKGLAIQSLRAGMQASWVTPEGHFRIYYDTTGFHAIGSEDKDSDGIPDRVEILGRYAEKARQLMVDTLGFHPPYDDNGHFVEIYDLYFRRLGSMYGQTIFSGVDIPSVPGFNMSSYIEINTSFEFAGHLNPDPWKRDSIAIAVTISHEFFHAIQLGYHVRFNTPEPEDDDLWWIEASATVFEEWCVPDGNDYIHYLSDFFRYSDESVYRQIGVKIYGEVVYPLVMEKLMGRQFMREIWENILNQNAVRTIETLLTGYQLSWGQLSAEVATWGLLAGKVEGSMVYTDLPSWPKLETIITPDSVVLETGVQKSLQFTPFSFQYLRLKAEHFSRFLASGDEGRDYFYRIWNGMTGGTDAFQLPFVFDMGGQEAFLIIAAGDIPMYDSATLRFTSFMINPELTSPVHPNPVRLDETEFVIFRSPVPIEQIRLYTVRGTLVKEYIPHYRGSAIVVPASELSSLQSGVYLFILGGDQKRLGKLMVIR